MSQAHSQGYSYKFKVNGVQDSTIYLANYFGSKLFYADTAKADKNGRFVFEGKEKLPRGKYAVVTPGPMWFEILIEESEFEITTDTTDWVKFMKIKNSPNNQIYYDYVKFISSKRAEMDGLNTELVEFASDSAKSKSISERILAINKEVSEGQKRVVEDNKHLLVGKMMKVNVPIEVPEAPTDENGNVTDELFQYLYYKEHFFDNCDLSDPAMGRLPDFDRKMDEFFKKVVVQTPDSAIHEADKLLNKVGTEGEFFKYTCNWLTVFFEKNKIMCMDAGFVHMVEEYYMKDLAFWVDSTSLSKVTERAMMMKPTICNAKAPYMKLQDSTGTKSYNLYDIDADFTIVYIWDPDCGHCKKTNPLLAEFYQNYKDKGIEVYSVGNPFETEKWIQYLKDNPEFAKMTNVSDSPERPSSFRTFYDVHTTPKLFILDKDKKIIAKQIEIEQLGEIIDHQLKMQEQIN